MIISLETPRSGLMVMVMGLETIILGLMSSTASVSLKTVMPSHQIQLNIKIVMEMGMEITQKVSLLIIARIRMVCRPLVEKSAVLI